MPIVLRNLLRVQDGEDWDHASFSNAEIPHWNSSSGKYEGAGFLSTDILKKDGSVALTGNWSAGTNRITSLGDPSGSTDAANKQYVDAQVAGARDVKESCRAATTAALPACTYANGTAGVGATLTANANGALAAQDGVTLVVNDRLLVKDQSSGLENGLYKVTTVGDGSNPFVLTRVTDADSAAEITAGLFTWIAEGTVNGDRGYLLTTNDTITVGTTALTFTLIATLTDLTAGDGLTKTGNSVAVNVDNATIEINADTLRVKDAGITLAKLESRARPVHNLLINGPFDHWQRQLTPTTLFSIADDVYGPDCWYALTQTAAIEAQKIAGSQARWAARLKQVQASAQRCGLAQIVEAADSIPTRSRSGRAQCRVRISNSQAVRIALLEWTGTADGVTSDVVNDWTNGTYTAGNFFLAASLTIVATATVTPSANTWTDLSVTGTISASCNNLIVLIWTEGTAAQDVTLDVEAAGLYDGADARDWLPRLAEIELSLCERFGVRFGGVDANERVGMGIASSTTAATIETQLRTPLRVSPTISVSANADWSLDQPGVANAALNATPTVSSFGFKTLTLACAVAAGLTAGSPYLLRASATTNAKLFLDASL